MKIGYDVYHSPIGPIGIVVDEIGVSKVEIFEDKWQDYLKNNPTIEHNKEMCKEAVKELTEYFEGTRSRFTVPFSTSGTDFTKKVWDALCEIPYGETRSYSDIANRVGSPKAVRAIGQANKRNNLAIMIPCHRVIGKNGKLTGYAGNRTNIKEKLLDWEQKNV